LNFDDLKPGKIIEGPKWPQPVEIKKVEVFGNDIHIIGSMGTSGIHVDVILSNDELTNISLKTINCDFSSEPWKVFLGLEAIRYRFASEYDPWLAMNTSKVDPLPHQIEAVYGVVLRMPRIRFLLAHDPGAGKTIMAGLIIKEMKLRNLVNRILIVVPGHLKDQWRRELKEKFEETFMVADRGATNALYGQNIWSHQNQLITSIDFAKREEILPSLDSSQFDLIVIDEAHKMAAYRYNDRITKTDRYQLGEVLSNNTEHLLFLTATPHKGDTENFRLFLDLLQPGFFATAEMLEESIEKNENTLFLRRIKEDMKDFDGKPLFLPRHVLTPSYDLSRPERELYRKVTEYVRNQYNRALSSEKKRNIGFALIILQRRLASSCFALWKSLTRRRDRLKELLEDFEKSKKSTPKIFDFEETEEMSEEERWQQESIWETLSIAENREELEREIQTLEDLIKETKNVIDQEVEVKLQKLKETMTLLEQKSINKKILIFTESKDTLEYLEKRIKSWGYDVNHIHGGMNLEERVEAEKIFKTETQVMVATEAAGEGINLQFCHLMINYDIPWNPNRLEQRMGRVHRYGQKFEVFVYNLLAQDTIEGRIFKRLFEKLEEIKAKMGSDKVYDIIGEIYRDKDLAVLLAEAAVGARTEAEIFATLEIKVNEDYIKKIKENLGDTLATKHIDFTRIKEERQKARENKLIPEYTAEFFKKAFTKAEGKIRERSRGLYAIDSIPYQIRKIAESDEFRKSFGHILKAYPKITFAKEVGPEDQDSEFLTFGHPLFEAVLEWINRSFSSELQKGAEFKDPNGQLDGNILFFEGQIHDGLGHIAGKRLFAYYVDSKTGVIEFVEPSILWDLQESQTHSDSVDIESLKIKTQTQIIESLRKYQHELQIERNRQTQIKEKYGIESLKKLIFDLDKDLVVLKERKRLGENVDLVIRNKEERQRQYLDNKKELENQIQREKNLTISTPTFLGIIHVVSPSTIQDEFRKDIETEQIAMRIVMEYEIKAGRKPKDVSKEIGPGYDIKSFDDDGNVRYIEVKGRKGIGTVALSKNEWFKAKHLSEDYYLYVVWNTEMYPNVSLPKIVQDPANRLEAKEDIHYLINSNEIESKAK
jgi:SNF2 family DNA or RNA helicase